jgi:hypothetical protein
MSRSFETLKHGIMAAIETTTSEMLGYVCRLDICYITRFACVKLTDSNCKRLLSCFVLIRIVYMRKCYDGETIGLEIFTELHIFSTPEYRNTFKLLQMGPKK